VKVGDLVKYHPIYDRKGLGIILEIFVKPGTGECIEICWNDGEIFADCALDYEIINETH